MNTVQNTWEPFDSQINDLLEEKSRNQESFCYAAIENEEFMFRLDRMVMYHCETGYMIRLKRKRVDHRQNISMLKRYQMKSPKDDHFERIIQSWSDHQKSLLKEICAIFPDSPVRFCAQALIKNVIVNVVIEILNFYVEFFS